MNWQANFHTQRFYAAGAVPAYAASLPQMGQAPSPGAGIAAAPHQLLGTSLIATPPGAMGLAQYGAVRGAVPGYSPQVGARLAPAAALLPGTVAGQQKVGALSPDAAALLQQPAVATTAGMHYMSPAVTSGQFEMSASQQQAQFGQQTEPRRKYPQRQSWGSRAEEDTDEPNIDPSLTVLDHFNSDLNFKIDPDGYGGEPILDPPGFCFCWSGARATYGVTQGKVCFEVYITDHLPVDFGDDHKEQDPHVVRVGWSRDSCSIQLGEEQWSYGFGGTGRFSVNCKFQRYGQSFQKGDVITACLDLLTVPPNISFCKNGSWMGIAHRLQGYPIGVKETALFPHILSKNCRLDVNFGQKQPWYPPPYGYTFIEQVPLQQRVRGMEAPPSKADCEMLMIVGLPGAGKTTWGIKMQKEHTEKRYNIIGTDTLIDKMKVMGLPRKNNYHGRWDVLISKATACLNKLFQIGSKRRRNYILDQTNVYASARKRKLRNFNGFQRKCCVLVTDDATLQHRSWKRTHEDGKFVPDSAVLEMKANFQLPQEGDQFVDEIIWIEWNRDQADPLVTQYREEGKNKRPSREVAFPHDSRNQAPLPPQLPPGQPPPPPGPPPPLPYGQDQPASKRMKLEEPRNSLDFLKQEYSEGQERARNQSLQQQGWQDTAVKREPGTQGPESFYKGAHQDPYGQAAWGQDKGWGAGGSQQSQFGGYGRQDQYGRSQGYGAMQQESQRGQQASDLTSPTDSQGSMYGDQGSHYGRESSGYGSQGYGQQSDSSRPGSAYSQQSNDPYGGRMGNQGNRDTDRAREDIYSSQRRQYGGQEVPDRNASGQNTYESQYPGWGNQQDSRAQDARSAQSDRGSNLQEYQSSRFEGSQYGRPGGMGNQAEDRKPINFEYGQLSSSDTPSYGREQGGLDRGSRGASQDMYGRQRADLDVKQERPWMSSGPECQWDKRGSNSGEGERLWDRGQQQTPWNRLSADQQAGNSSQDFQSGIHGNQNYRENRFGNQAKSDFRQDLSSSQHTVKQEKDDWYGSQSACSGNRPGDQERTRDSRGNFSQQNYYQRPDRDPYSSQGFNTNFPDSSQDIDNSNDPYGRRNDRDRKERSSRKSRWDTEVGKEGTGTGEYWEDIVARQEAEKSQTQPDDDLPYQPLAQDEPVRRSPWSQQAESGQSSWQRPGSDQPSFQQSRSYSSPQRDDYRERKSFHGQNEDRDQSRGETNRGRGGRFDSGNFGRDGPDRGRQDRGELGRWERPDRGGADRMRSGWDGPGRGGPDRGGPNRDNFGRGGPGRDGARRGGRDGSDRGGPGRDIPERGGPGRDSSDRGGPGRDGPDRGGPGRDGPDRGSWRPREDRPWGGRDNSHDDRHRSGDFGDRGRQDSYDDRRRSEDSMNRGRRQENSFEDRHRSDHSMGRGRGRGGNVPSLLGNPPRQPSVGKGDGLLGEAPKRQENRPDSRSSEGSSHRAESQSTDAHRSADKNSKGTDAGSSTGKESILGEPPKVESEKEESQKQEEPKSLLGSPPKQDQEKSPVKSLLDLSTEAPSNESKSENAEKSEDKPRQPREEMAPMRGRGRGRGGHEGFGPRPPRFDGPRGPPGHFGGPRPLMGFGPRGPPRGGPRGLLGPGPGPGPRPLMRGGFGPGQRWGRPPRPF